MEKEGQNAPTHKECIQSGYVWRVRWIALHVREGSRVASVPAQGNSFAAKCAIMGNRYDQCRLDAQIELQGTKLRF